MDLYSTVHFLGVNGVPSPIKVGENNGHEQPEYDNISLLVTRYSSSRSVARLEPCIACLHRKYVLACNSPYPWRREGL
jgi:hypothetical protein